MSAWSVQPLEASAARTSASKPAASASAASSSPPSMSRKARAMYAGVALYALLLLAWWVSVRDGAFSLGRLRVLDAAGADDVDVVLHPSARPGVMVPSAVPNVKCLGWRQTGGCDPNGPREPEMDQPCGTLIKGGVSGYCALEDATTGEELRGFEANCTTIRGDVSFKCSQAIDIARMPALLTHAVAKVAATNENDDGHRPALRAVEGEPSRGIVMVVYPKLLVSVHASVRLLRSYGCTLPVELWFLEKELGMGDPTESRPLLRSLVDDFGPVTLRGIDDGRVLGFASKVHAVAHSSFDQVLFLDADNTPVKDPTYLFHGAKFAETGAVFWPDFWHPGHTIFNIHEHSLVWQVLDTPFVDMFEQESGQLLIDRRRSAAAFAALEFLALHRPNHFANLKLAHGDKDLFRFAWLKTGTPFHMVETPPAAAGSKRARQFCGMTMVQHDPDDGAVLFLHRNAKKLTGTEDLEKDQLWTHIQSFVMEGETPADRYAFAKQHYEIGIRGSASKFARTSMCYGDSSLRNKHFELTAVADLPFRDLEATLLQFARDAAAMG